MVTNFLLFDGVLRSRRVVCGRTFRMVVAEVAWIGRGQTCLRVLLSRSVHKRYESRRAFLVELPNQPKGRCHGDVDEIAIDQQRLVNVENNNTRWLGEALRGDATYKAKGSSRPDLSKEGVAVRLGEAGRPVK